MATDKENGWTAAAAFDSGEGLQLQEHNPDDNEDTQLLHQASKVNDLHAKKRLKRCIRSLLGGVSMQPAPEEENGSSSGNL